MYVCMSVYVCVYCGRGGVYVCMSVCVFMCACMYECVCVYVVWCSGDVFEIPHQGRTEP